MADVKQCVRGGLVESERSTDAVVHATGSPFLVDTSLKAGLNARRTAGGSILDRPPGGRCFSGGHRELFLSSCDLAHNFVLHCSSFVLFSFTRVMRGFHRMSRVQLCGRLVAIAGGAC